MLSVSLWCERQIWGSWFTNDALTLADIQEEIEMIDNRIADELAVAGEGHGVLGYIKGAFRELMLPGIRNRV